jgi:nucleoside-specific outer membrane channel protein Tsx
MNMTFKLLTFLLLSLSLSAEDLDWFKPNYMQHSISYLRGNTYEFGDRDRSTGSIDHFSVWNWGELYAFMDYSYYDNGHDDAYYEIKPKISLNYLTGEKLEYGIIKDVFIANEFNHSTEKTTEVYLTGLGVKLDVPYFQWWNMNLYWRNDIKVAGEGTYQFSTDWAIPINLHPKIKIRCEGFADFAGTEGNSTHNILFSPQLIFDVGNLFGKPDTLFTGTEYINWQNKYGVDGVNEEVWQFIIKYYF